MDRLEAMSMFLVVAELGSFAAAARRLGCSPASVTRAISQLEKMAGERLVERTSRSFKISSAGSRHIDAYRTVLEELSRLNPRHSGPEVSGDVVISASELFGAIHVMPVVEDFLKKYPRTQVRVLLLNRYVDLVGEGIDVAVRIGNLPDSSMHAIKLGEVRRVICASPAYLETSPLLKHPTDLKDHFCIGVNEFGPHQLWKYRENDQSRRACSVRVKCRLALNSTGAAIKAAERDLGIVRALLYQVRQQISDGILVPILKEYDLEPVPVHMIFRDRKMSSNALQAFIQHVSPALKLACWDQTEV